VLFESPLAAGLLGGFVQAVSGGALYRKSSFLLDSLGKQVFPKHIDMLEDPHVLRGKGSSPFDEEGVRTSRARWWSAGGAGLFPQQLFGPQAGHEDHRQRRRLAQPGAHLAPDPAGRRPGRHAAKAGHRPVRDRADGPGRELRDGRLFARRQRLLGRKRPIAYPVQEITIAGNLKDMLKGIEAVGADAYNYGAKTVGSILVNRMKVAGSGL
jgi:PmbA protein